MPRASDAIAGVGVCHRLAATLRGLEFHWVVITSEPVTIVRLVGACVHACDME